MVEKSGPARYISEFLGTFILTIVVGCNTLTNAYVWGATSNACTLMVLIYAFGDVSGGHFNPAVSIANFISLRLSFGEMLIYIMVQLLGAALGAVSYSFMFYQSFNVAPMPGFNWWNASLAESTYTFMLCFVVLNCAMAARTSSVDPAAQFAPLAIGFVLIAGAYGAGAISGGCFNPAIALAIDVSSAGLGFGWSIAYIGFELVGAAFAGVFYRLCRPGEFEGCNDPLLKRAAGEDIRLSMLLSEFLGTFVLTVTVGLNVLSSSRSGAWSIGAALMCMIYSLGDVSGAHFNPAVTLAIMATDIDLKPPKAAIYMATQFLAGIFGAWFFSIAYGWETMSLGPAGNYSWAARAPAEIFFTFVLCLTVLSVACVKARKVQDEYFGLAIGLAISVGGYAVGMISGGTMNPAVTLGIGSTSALCPDCMHFFWSFAYIALEFFAGLLAAVIFRACRPEEYLGFPSKAEQAAPLRDEPAKVAQNAPPPASNRTNAPSAVTQSHRTDAGMVPPSTMQPTLMPGQHPMQHPGVAPTGHPMQHPSMAPHPGYAPPGSHFQPPMTQMPPGGHPMTMPPMSMGPGMGHPGGHPQMA